MNLNQLEDFLVKTITDNMGEPYGCNSYEVIDGKRVFFEFFNKLGESLGIHNFAKIVLIKSRFNSNGVFEATTKLSIKTEAVEKFVVQFASAADAVEHDITHLYDVSLIDDYTGEAKGVNFAFAVYEFNHLAFKIRISANLEVYLSDPTRGILTTRVSIS